MLFRSLLELCPEKNKLQEGKKSSSRALFFWHSLVLTGGPLGTCPPSNLLMIYVLRGSQSLSLHLVCLEALGRRILCKNTGAGAHVPKCLQSLGWVRLEWTTELSACIYNKSYNKLIFKRRVALALICVRAGEQ